MANTAAIQDYYTTILNRAATDQELATWGKLIDVNALTPAQVQTDIANSFEAFNNVAPIVEMYQADLNHLPDQAGLFQWVQWEDNGTYTLAQIGAFIAGGSGSQALYGPTVDQTFLNKLYQNALGRQPEPGALAAWQATGLTTAQIVADVALAPGAVARATVPVTTFLINAVNNPATAYTGTLYSATGTGTTFTLTTGIDTPAITGNNNIVNGVANGSAITIPSTYTPGDTIVAPTGSTGNVLNLSDATTGAAWTNSTNVAGITVSGIQTLNLVSGEAVTGVNTASSIEGFTGLTALNIKDVGGTGATAAGTTAVSVNDLVAGAAGESVLGGSNDTVTAAGVTTGGPGIIIGSTTAAPTGTITATVSDANTGSASVTGSAITTTGGTTVAVTQNIAAATSDTTANTATGGAVKVNGGATTTTVTVNQTAPVGQLASAAAAPAVPASPETVVISFADLAQGVGVTIGDVLVTATAVGGIPAATLAAVFANLAAGTTPTVVGGTVTGSFQSGFHTGPVTGVAGVPTVTATANTNAVGDNFNLGSLVAGQYVQTAGTAGSPGTPAVAAVGGIADGVVAINDVNGSDPTKAGTITTATLTNYGVASTISDNALASLTLAGTGGGLTITDSLATPTATTLALALNGLTDASATGIADAQNEITTLNVTTGGTTSSSLSKFTDTGLKTLNVSGTQSLSLTTATSATAINVSGGAGLTTALNGTTAFTSTSTGTDIVTLSGATTKTVTGNGSAAEELVWNAAGPGLNTALATGTGTVSGFKVLGIGASAGSGTFDLSAITGFTGIDIQGGAGAAILKATAGTPLAIDAATTTVSYNTADTAGATDSLGLTLGLAANKAGFIVGALTLGDLGGAHGIGNLTVTSNASTTAASNTISTLNDASLSTLNVAGTGGLAVTGAFTTNATSLTINGTSTGTGGITFTGGVSDTALTTLTLTGTDAIALGTVTNGTAGTTVVGGADNANVSLALAGATLSGKTDSITLGSGNVTVSDSNAVAGATVNITVGNGGTSTTANSITVGAANATISAGSGVNTIAVGNGANTISVGNGNDTISVGNGLNAITIGTGTDTLNFIAPGANGLTYSTVTGAQAADTLNFTHTAPGALAGSAVAQVSALGGNATFSDYLNAAAATGNTAGDVSWFQFNNNTFVVANIAGGGTFTAGSDYVVGLSGLHTFGTGSTLTQSSTVTGLTLGSHFA